MYEENDIVVSWNLEELDDDDKSAFERNIEVLRLKERYQQAKEIIRNQIIAQYQYPVAYTEWLNQEYSVILPPSSQVTMLESTPQPFGKLLSSISF